MTDSDPTIADLILDEAQIIAEKIRNGEIEPFTARMILRTMQIPQTEPYLEINGVITNPKCNREIFNIRFDETDLEKPTRDRIVNKWGIKFIGEIFAFAHFRKKNVPDAAYSYDVHHLMEFIESIGGTQYFDYMPPWTPPYANNPKVISELQIEMPATCCTWLQTNPKIDFAWKVIMEAQSESNSLAMISQWRVFIEKRTTSIHFGIHIPAFLDENGNLKTT